MENVNFPLENIHFSKIVHFFMQSPRHYGTIVLYTMPEGEAMTEKRMSDLTIGELKQLIRATVQEAVAEVLIEFATAAEIEAKISQDAEITDFLRANLQNRQRGDDGLGMWDWDD